MNSKRVIYVFILKAIVAYLVWFFLYEQWLAKVGRLDDLIIDNLIFFSGALLKIFSYEYFIYNHIIGIDGSHGVYIGVPCNGLELIALFTCFIVIFKGSWKTKVWYVPLGIAIVHLLNICRIFALILIENYNPEALEFNHKYTFTVILYLFVFMGWMIWVKKYSRLDDIKNEE